MHDLRQVPPPGAVLEGFQQGHGHGIANHGNDVDLLTLGQAPDALGIKFELRPDHHGLPGKQ
ncbi:hypothetical protein D3C86_1338400 [compost metagenome]